MHVETVVNPLTPTVAILVQLSCGRAG